MPQFVKGEIVISYFGDMKKISAVASGLDRLLSDFQTIVDLSEQYVAASYTRKLLCQKINVWTFIDSFLFRNCFIVNP